MRKNSLTVSIVIPNWNGKSLLEKHLPAVVAASNSHEIIVVDDASTDNSVDFLKKHYPQIRIIIKDSRKGYSSAVNLGVAEAKSQIVVLLNSDIEPEKEFLAPLLNHFTDLSVFAVGCMDKSIEGDSVVLRGRGEASWQKGFYIHRRGNVNAKDTAWVSGGSGAFRKSIWTKLGGMNELYNPYYWEDIDLSYRARKAGYSIMFEPESIVTHHHEHGAIQSNFSANTVTRIAYRNQFFFIWINCTDTFILGEHIVWTPIRLVQASVKGDFLFVLGFFDALSHLSQAMTSRRRVMSFWQTSDRKVCHQYSS